MPSGRAHTAATIVLVVGSLPFANPALTVGCLSGLIISPDIDCDDGFIGLAHLRRFGCVGNVLSWIWRAFWYPYSKFVPHRSPISHSIVVGTIIRVAYLLLPVLAMSFFGFPLRISSAFGWWFVGLCASDALHVIMDWFWSALKGRKNA